MTHDDGEWLPVADAARQVRVRTSAIYVWINRGMVQRHRIQGRVWVYMPSVMEAEYAWRMRALAKREAC